MTAGCICAIVAVGFTIIYNTAGAINFAQGEFVMAAGPGALAGLTVSPVFYTRVNMGTALGLKGFCAAVLGASATPAAA